MCPPFVSLLVSAHFHWPCNISIHLSPGSATMQRCLPFSAGREAFLFMCLPGLSLLPIRHFYSFVSQVCHLRCPPFSAGDTTSIHLFPSSVAARARPFPLAMQHFYSFVSQDFSAGHVAFLFICLHLSLLVSALFRWPCSISTHLSCRSVTGPPFSAGNVAFLVVCLPALHCWCPPFSVGGVRPWTLAM